MHIKSYQCTSVCIFSCCRNSARPKLATPFTCVPKATIEWRAGRKQMTWRKPERCTTGNSRPHYSHWSRSLKRFLCHQDPEHKRTLSSLCNTLPITNSACDREPSETVWPGKRFVPLEAEDGFWFCTIIFPMAIQVEWKFILVALGRVCKSEAGRPHKVKDEELQLNEDRSAKLLK